MALTKISRGLLNTGVSDSSDATAITIDSSENVTISGDLTNSSSGVTTSKVSTSSASDSAHSLVYNSGDNGISLISYSGSASGTLFGLNRANKSFFVSNLETVIGTTGSNFLSFATNTTERMRIASDGQLNFNSGFGSVGKAYGVRAWARFDGSNSSGSFTEGTNAGNMSSFTRTATGNFSLTMTSAMPDTNYVVSALASQACLVRGDNDDLASSTTVIKIEVTNGNGASFANADEITVMVVR